MDTSPENMKRIVEFLIMLVLSIAVHEFGHAFVADRLGDRLPRSQGRVTLNPVAHADPIGTLALPTLSMLLASSIGLGWGRPVMVNPAAFTRRFTMRVGHMFVALAGPMMNLLFGVTISFVLLILLRTETISPVGELAFAIRSAVILNFGLMFFNLIPAPPLDGGAVVTGLLPIEGARWYERNIAPYGLFIVMAFLMIPQLRIIVTWPTLKLYELWVIGVLGI
jgi:Zn-dependent protease